MNYFIIFIALGLFIGLFSIYSLGKDDLIFLRKDISMEKLFNLVFMVFIVGLFFSRAIYVMIYAPRMFLNPLAFFLFPYFPGLSLLGGVIGGIGFLFLYGRKKTVPLGRIFDYFSLGFLTSLPIGYLGHFILTLGENYYSLGLSLIYITLIVIFLKYFFQILQKGVLRDGSLALIFFMLFSLISFLNQIAQGFSGLLFIKQPETYLFGALALTLLGFFIRQEKIIKSRRR